MTAGCLPLIGCHRASPRVGGDSILAFDHPEAAALTTLMTAEILKRGYLTAAGFNATLINERGHASAYLNAPDELLAELADAIQKGDVESRIGGPVKHSGFARLT